MQPTFSPAAQTFAPGDRIIQEQIAQALGVSRQPVQQALALLRNQGVLHDAPGRGLIVAPLDPGHVQHMYDMRAVIEGLACRRAAETNAERAAKLGPALIEAGRKAFLAAYERRLAQEVTHPRYGYTLSYRRVLHVQARLLARTVQGELPSYPGFRTR